MSFEVCYPTANITIQKKDLTRTLQMLTEGRKNLVWRTIAPDPASSQMVLNGLQPQILQTDDKNLIALFKRAVLMHNTRYPAEKANPVEIYQKHYQPSKFQIPRTEVILEIQEFYVKVTTHLEVERVQDAATLILNGVDHDVISATLNGDELKEGKDFVSTPHELIVKSLPSENTFSLCITSLIYPYKNTSFKGLYCSGKNLTTHCESEGARRIFFCLDRPDILSEYKVTLIADPKHYPCRLSNGNLISDSETAYGTMSTIWHDPYKKPSYLFAVVLGDFAVLEDTYQKKDGSSVLLQFYLDHEKKQRGAYALWMLKNALQFEEEEFDRPYDLSVLKMVSISDFNSGAMENKGLIIFNEECILADSQSALDGDFVFISQIISHELCHNWSGNRVTIRDWFELALKEGFTDFRATLFLEYFYSKDLIRPSQALALQERQFPQDASASAHPIQVESFIDPRSIYDETTYIKGREVFRMLMTLLEEKKSGLFRIAQNIYFQRYDGKAVTFKELLQTMEDVSGIDLKQFSLWFTQPGTPTVTVTQNFDPDKNRVTLTIKQSCPHPKTKQRQKPFHIPFALEVLSKEGKVIVPIRLISLKDEESAFVIEDVQEEVIPVFLHDYSAPILCEYHYTDQELVILILNAGDIYPRFVAMKELMKRKIMSEDLDQTTLDLIRKIVMSNKFSPLEKAYLLELPPLRSLANHKKEFDFVRLERKRQQFKMQLGRKLHSNLLHLLKKYQSPENYDPISANFPDEIYIRKFRGVCLEYLSFYEERYFDLIWSEFLTSKNFNEKLTALRTIVHSGSSARKFALDRFFQSVRGDKGLFSHWLKVQASSPLCNVEMLKEMTSTPGYEADHPNHVYALWNTFVTNLSAFHDELGKGYACVVDEIVRLSQKNPELAESLLSRGTVDYHLLPRAQRDLMRVELQRLTGTELPPEIVDLAKKIIAS